MNPEHKKYILRLFHKKSINKITQELGLKERKIRRFLEKQKQKKKPLESKEEIRPHIKKTTLLVSILLIIILGFFVYSNSLNGEFIWDDEILIVDNVYLLLGLAQTIGVFQVVKELLKSSPGEIPIYLHLDSQSKTQTQLVVGEGFFIKPNEKLIADIENLLGEEKLSLVI